MVLDIKLSLCSRVMRSDSRLIGQNNSAMSQPDEIPEISDIALRTASNGGLGIKRQ